MVAAKSSFKITGVDELVKKLRMLRGPAMKKVYRQAMRAAARPVLATAKQIVPIASGKLQKSLKIRALRRSRKLIGVQITPGTRSELGISGKGFYPTHIELGFKRGGLSKFPGRKGGITKFPGNRYLRDALLLERTDAMQIINARITAGITKIVISKAIK